MQKTQMGLDLDRLERPKIKGGKLIARCPACAELGADKSCEHLVVLDGGRGRFGCIMYPGPSGHEHRQRIAEIVGNLGPRNQPILATRTLPKPSARGKPRLPALRPLNVAELTSIALLRGWHSFAGLELLTQRGLLWHGQVFDDGREWPAWIVTDSSRMNAQARRLDGCRWSGIGNVKAKTLPGSDPSWPIGAADIGGRKLIVLCEGGPDFLAALLVAWLEGVPPDIIAPCCMAGAANGIHPNALGAFAGRQVRIAVHDDEKGREAGRHWARQLYGGGAASVDGFDFAGISLPNGSPCKDLANYAALLWADMTKAAECE